MRTVINTACSSRITEEPSSAGLITTPRLTLKHITSWKVGARTCYPVAIEWESHSTQWAMRKERPSLTMGTSKNAPSADTPITELASAVPSAHKDGILLQVNGTMLHPMENENKNEDAFSIEGAY